MAVTRRRRYGDACWGNWKTPHLLNSALLSRAQVMVLDRLDRAALEAILSRLEAHIGRDLPIDDEARAALRHGRWRWALVNMASLLVEMPATTRLDSRGLAGWWQARTSPDRAGDQHYV